MTDFARESRLAEEACEFERAAETALLAYAEEVRSNVEKNGAGTSLASLARVFRLFSLAGARVRIEAAIATISLAAEEWKALAERLSTERPPFASALLFERAGDRKRASELFEAAHEPVRAARLCQDDAVRAARLLESHLEDRPSDADARLLLAQLLMTHGKWQAAVRALQLLPEADGSNTEVDATTRGIAEKKRTLLAHAYAALDLKGARAELLSNNASPTAPDGIDASLDASAAKDDRGTLLFERYEVVREVASTATARVLEAVDRKTNARVAVKIFAPNDSPTGRDAVLRFRREIELLRTLRHPHIVRALDAYDVGPTLVMPWMTGGTLGDLLERERMAPRRAFEIAKIVLDALGTTHRRGILHRDIKPANVLFDEIGAPTLADFGAAHFGDLSQTATAGLIGTLAYMSPEQRRGEPATIASDLYGVGALLFEMLTLERYDEGTKTRPSEVHRGLDERHDRAVLSLLDASREQRPENAEAATQLLSELSWPNVVDLSPRKKPEIEPIPTSQELRVVTRGGVQIDRFTEIPVQGIPLTDDALVRLKAYAQVDAPELQAVLRVDRERATIWVEAVDASRRAESLSSEALARLRRIVQQVHREGAAHGSLEESVVLASDGNAFRLLLPTRFAGTIEQDLAFFVNVRLPSES